VSREAQAAGQRECSESSDSLVLALVLHCIDSHLPSALRLSLWLPVGSLSGPRVGLTRDTVTA
jgi:hypothetical protein